VIPTFCGQISNSVKQAPLKVRKLTMEIDSKVEGLNYWLSHCNGVKKCEECDHVLPKSYSKNNCKEHPEADLIATEGCPVEFINFMFIRNMPKTKEGGSGDKSEVLRWHQY